MTLSSSIEAMLFAAAQPLSLAKLANACEVTVSDIASALDELGERLEASQSGLQLVRHDKEVELVTHPDAAELVRKVIKLEAQGELSRPSLEALAVLAYRGPMTRPELEQIRGVQSSMILRNLMMRGLVEITGDERLGQPVYAVTIDFLNHLGMEKIESLPEFEALHGHTAVAQVLEELAP